MKFNVYVNVLHADGTVTPEYRTGERLTRDELGMLIELALRDARLEFDAMSDNEVALDLTITHAWRQS